MDNTKSGDQSSKLPVRRGLPREDMLVKRALRIKEWIDDGKTWQWIARRAEIPAQQVVREYWKIAKPELDEKNLEAIESMAFQIFNGRTPEEAAKFLKRDIRYTAITSRMVEEARDHYIEGPLKVYRPVNFR